MSMDDLYPELRSIGLFGALQAEVDSLHPGLVLTSSPKERFSAGCELGSRTASATCAAEERGFHVDLWNEGVQCLSGWSAELPEAAQAFARWFGTPAPVRELAETFAFLTANPLALAYESGTAIEYGWHRLMEEPVHEELRPLIDEASRRPDLRRLYPFTSMYSLCFSRWVGYPFSDDLPSATWRTGRFDVFDPAQTALGSGDAATAARLLVGAVPTGVTVLYRRPTGD